MNINFANKRALVTGAGRGMAKQIILIMQTKSVVIKVLAEK